MHRTPGDFPEARANTDAHAQSCWRLSRRAKWDLVVGVSGVIYVALTLWLSLDSPLLSLLFIALAGYDLLAGRNRS
jgi:hypothetical protein